MTEDEGAEYEGYETIFVKDKILNQTQNPSFKGVVLYSELQLMLFNFKREPDDKMKFCKLDQKVFSYNQAIYLPDFKDFLHSTFKWKVTQLIQGGFFNHWMEPYLNHRSIVEKELDENKIVLTMEHMTVGFTIWLAFLTISSIAFIVELTRFKCRNLCAELFLK